MLQTHVFEVCGVRSLVRIPSNTNVSSRKRFSRPAAASADVKRLEGPSEKWFGSPRDQQILNLAIPTLCANILTPLSTSIDASVIGRLGAAQLSGVGLGSTSLSLFTSVLAFVPILLTPVIAQKEAQGRDISADIARGLWFSLMIGVAASIAMFFSAEILKPAVEIQPYALAYMKTISLLPPAMLLFHCLGGIYRGLKDGKTILKAMIVSSFANLFLDILFVFGFGWSVVGVGLATVVATYGAVSVLFCQLLPKNKLRLEDLVKLPNFKDFLPIISEGMRLGFRSFTVMSSIVIASALMARQGAVIHSAYEITRQTSMLIYVVYAAIEQTVQALTASAIGSKDLESAQSIIIRCIQLSTGMCFTVSSLLVLCSGKFAGLFTTNPAVIAAFVSIAPFHLLTAVFPAFVSAVDGSLIGARRSRTVASAQTVGGIMAIATLCVLQQNGWLTLLSTVVAVRLSFCLHGLFTSFRLFFAKDNPYGFNVQP